MTRHRDAVVFLGLLALAAGLFLFRLGTPGLFDADEPAYAGAAREMLQTGDWITPRFNGQTRFDKPILFYWLIVLAYKAFGVTEFAVRLWSAVAGVGLVGLVTVVARRTLGRPADLWAGLALLTSLLTALLARAAVTDMLLTLCVSGAVFAGLRAIEAPPDAGKRWALLVWAAMALAVLVKGPVGLVIPAMALLPALWLLREARFGLRRLVSWQGPLLFAAMALPWYGMVLHANGWAFVEGFILKHHVSRYVGVVSSHAGPLWFYLPVLLFGFFPWSAFLPAGLAAAWGVARRRQAESGEDRLLVVCAAWAVGLFLFFSLAGTKLPSYLFPAFPALALLAGHALAAASRGAKDGRPALRFLAAAPWLFAGTAAILAGGMAALPVILDRVRPVSRGVLDDVGVPVWLTSGLAAWVVLGAALALALGWSRRGAVLAVMMVGLILAAEVLVAPQVYRIAQAPLRAFTQEARAIAGAGGPVVVYGLNAPTIVFYADRPVLRLGADDPAALEALAAMARSGRPVAVITRRALASRLAELPGFSQQRARGGYALFRSSGAGAPS